MNVVPFAAVWLDDDPFVEGALKILPLSKGLNFDFDVVVDFGFVVVLDAVEDLDILVVVDVVAELDA